MKFVDTYEGILEKLESCQVILVIFVDPSIMMPSESLIKYFSYHPIAVELEPYIFAYKGTEIKAFEMFNVLNYPQVTVIKEKPSNVLFNFIGCNQERGWEALSVLASALGKGKPTRKLNTQRKYCPKSHQLKLIKQMQQTTYRNGFFQCNSCKMLSHVTPETPILHCSICQFDICNTCSHIDSMN